MQWKKVEPWTGKIWRGCLNCPPVEQKAPLDTLVAVGFGYAAITRDGEQVYVEPARPLKRYRRLRSFERMAAKNPEHDWRLILDAPLRGRTYQRHGPGEWVLIESNGGFA